MENIATALAAFQAEMPTVTKSVDGQVGTRKYKYADLADVTKAAAPLLSKNGLSFCCMPELIEGTSHYQMRGVLLHSSGEVLSGVFPLSGQTPQELGSSITYARRYLFGCLTGIVTDDDDDGAAASRTQFRQPSDQELTSDARAKAWAAWKAAGMPDSTDTFRATYEGFMEKPFNGAAAADFNEFASALQGGRVTGVVDPTEAFQRALGAQTQETPA